MNRYDDIRRVKHSPRTAAGYLNTGLFGDDRLATPDGFRELTEESLARSRRLVAMIRSANTDGALRDAVRRLDELSDALCRVLDLAEFVRHVHPDPRYVEEAHRAFERLFSFMNTLNTDTGLYQTLRELLTNRRVASRLGEEERRVAELFLRDFERSGIHLPATHRRQFVALSDEILGLSRQFMHRNDMHDAPIPYVEVKRAEYARHCESSVRGATRHGDMVRLPTSDIPARTVLRFYGDETVRERMYRAMHTVRDEQVKVLDDLLVRRAALAKLVGWDSFADMSLDGKMAGSSESVRSFLDGLASQHLPQAQQDLKVLEQEKARHTGASSASMLHAWDRDYYTYHARQRHFSAKHDGHRRHDIGRDGQDTTLAASFQAYTSIGRCIQGISRLLEALYGIRLEPAATVAGEIWHASVRKLAVVDAVHGRIGTIYCDLADRPGKPTGAAHYTVRCARRVWPDELPATPIPAENLVRRGEHMRQLPVVVLVCGFTQETVGLSFYELETLFHEMGHAVHSMLGQTEFHNVAGTRCATDFVEFPSILFEQFASDHRVLGLFARHYQTGEPMPPSILQRQLDQRAYLAALDRHHQIMLAFVDQLYHGVAWKSTLGDGLSDRLLADAENNPRYSLFPHVTGARWQMDFTHLITYGAGYYAYLLGRALAGQAWRQWFAANPLNRAAGERLRHDVLRWGGARDPWRCMGDLLEDEQIREGGAVGMSRVGTFGWQAS
ncbi:hypothetical protein SYNPS1DRAFT_32803 [Syncephalis pseudoplumigaleata]|uniref:mitochondrial intermediate peptidase n=1 Tax=Syncephalis pseudoplumigaleata TaxID=1712513 RepID=A0A4P9Z1G0_9FUNG|nr:hypothetical protein SYNPS1DRAFT_32803 [Syncephalis pseudoplumigaleata]|eukprot:RKP26168.1 hypothetical protein SYNPS1DRAFT_32803 [Syncephalis pseudoplumigaleata]